MDADEEQEDEGDVRRSRKRHGKQPRQQQQQQRATQVIGRDAGADKKGMAAALRAKLAGGGGGDNKDTAAALRAKLAGGSAAGAGDGAGGGGGNRSTAAALRAKLLGHGGAADGAGGGGGKEREVVHLPMVDASGRAMPGTFGREAAGEAARGVERAVGGRAPKRVQRYGEDGEKTRYFADDDAVDLQVGEGWVEEGRVGGW